MIVSARLVAWTAAVAIRLDRQGAVTTASVLRARVASPSVGAAAGEDRAWAWIFYAWCETSDVPAFLSVLALRTR